MAETQPSSAGIGPYVSGLMASAKGAITIDTSQLAQAQAQVNAFATSTTASMTGVTASVNATQQGVSSLTATLRGLASGFGVGLSAAGVAQLVKAGAAAAVNATETATAYARQEVAARSLAGSQAQLNALLVAYDKASGGVIDKATAMANVTRLLATGFAQNVGQLDEFVRGVRGASIAMGKAQEEITQEVQLAITNNSFKRLDQIGLGVAEVTQRINDLRSANHSLSESAAFQTAVLGLLNEKFGDLAKSAEGQKTGLEKVGVEGKNLFLILGQILGPTVNAVGEDFARHLKVWEDGLQAVIALANKAAPAVGAIGRAMGLIGPDMSSSLASRTTIGRVTPIALSANPMAAERQAATVEWYKSTIDLNNRTNAQLTSENDSFREQQLSSEAAYHKSLAREAEDYATSRARAERDLQDSIADINADAARRQVQMAADLARTIAGAQRDSADRLANLQEDLDRTVGQRRADSAERIADLDADRDKDIAEKRVDSGKRLLEIEQSCNEEREKAEAQYKLSRQSAAMRLDARALFELDAQHKLESEQALDARDKQIADEKDKLQEAINKVNQTHQERLDDEKRALDKSIKQSNEAHDRQVADEKESLEKRIANANEAYQRQLADAQAADAQRIEDMKTAFDKEQQQASLDYGTRLLRQEQDHNDQLDEMGRQHTLRITQIGSQGKAERDALDDEFEAKMADLGVQTDAYIAEQDRIGEAAKTAFDNWWKHVNDVMTKAIGPVTNPNADPALDPRRKQLQDSINGWMMQQAATDDPAEKKRLQGLIDDAQDEIDKLGPAAATVSGAAFNMPTASAYAPMPAMAAGAMMGGSNRSLTVGDIHVTINGVSTNTANDILDVVDKRILHQIQVAAGRL